MKRTIYIAVANVNNMSDDALCEVFSTKKNAIHWIRETIIDAVQYGFTVYDINTQIYEREIYL